MLGLLLEMYLIMSAYLDSRQHSIYYTQCSESVTYAFPMIGEVCSPLYWRDVQHSMWNCSSSQKRSNKCVYLGLM